MSQPRRLAGPCDDGWSMTTGLAAYLHHSCSPLATVGLQKLVDGRAVVRQYYSFGVSLTRQIFDRLELPIGRCHELANDANVQKREAGQSDRHLFLVPAFNVQIPIGTSPIHPSHLGLTLASFIRNPSISVPNFYLCPLHAHL